MLTWLVAAFAAAGADLASAAAAASSSEYSSSLSVGGIMPAVAGCPAARLQRSGGQREPGVQCAPRAMREGLPVLG